MIWLIYIAPIVANKSKLNQLEISRLDGAAKNAQVAEQSYRSAMIQKQHS
jgi:hypothetical protein